MTPYSKIPSIYKRDPNNKNKTFLDGQFTTPELEWLRDCKWEGTEKIDGTNIRVIYEDGKIEFRGRSDNASIPPMLLKSLHSMFSVEKLKTVFNESLCIYGEGFGSKIQRDGHHYLSDACSFIIFDIKIGIHWLRREYLENIGRALGIAVVPLIFIGKLMDALNLVEEGFTSRVAQNIDYVAEGLILKPPPNLLDRSGNRIITKIKHKDFN